MKSSDYIVEFFERKGIKHFFGYQGTMIAHLVDSIYRNKNVNNHCCYNEQGAGFAAVGSAKATGDLAVAYATSGPGAANLISAIADAYYDSAPVIFITGQLNTYEYLNIDGIRQNGFQEMDVISSVKAITKYCAKVEKIDDLRFILEKSYYTATEGRPGPVVIDLPMDMQRQEVEPEKLKQFVPELRLENDNSNTIAKVIVKALKESKAPVLLLGNGLRNDSGACDTIIDIAKNCNIPVITSMLGRDLLAYDDGINMGHLGGGYGHRYANIIIDKKADLIISLGCSMCKRQTAMKTEEFAKNAKIIRVDIDSKELERKVHESEQSYLADCRKVIDAIEKYKSEIPVFESWLEKCKKIRKMLELFDDGCAERKPNKFVEEISRNIDDNTIICCDVGQHQVWTSQSFLLKKNQKLLFSGGHGAMGFALPAAIGASIAEGKRAVAICGDGAMQMNIQELQWVFREQLPVSVVVLNNSSLGLIQQQQDDIFDGVYAGSLDSGGYLAPDFHRIGKAYGIDSVQVTSIDDLSKALKQADMNKPFLAEVILDPKSRAYPKTFFGERMYNQRPYIPDGLMEEILKA